MQNIAFIPLRGGSVSIPLKNIKLLNGRPLAYYVLDAVTQCDLIDTVVVATDSKMIEQTIKEYPSNKIMVVGRSSEVSTHTSPTIDVVLEFSEQFSYQKMVLVQATSPLVQVKDIEGGLQLMKEYNSVLSVVRQHRFIWDEETHVPNYTMPHKPRRQDWKGILVENGAFYINTRENILKDRFYLSGNIGLFEMSSDTYVEIDEEQDWLFMEHLLQKRNSNNC
ncbi:MAG: acylneuraminate cytidylyltransferase family protein [Brevinema sp.]